MQNYARVIDGMVRETIATEDGLPPHVHPDLVFVPCPADVVQRWTLNGSAFSPPVVPVDYLLAYAAKARYRAENKNIHVAGKLVAANRDARAALAAEISALDATPELLIDWKFADGSWGRVKLADLTAFAAGISAYKQTCFTAEKLVTAGINATPPTVTSVAQIDASFNSLAP